MQRTSSDISYSSTEEAISRYAKALSHPVRVRILKFLEKRTCCFTGLLADEIPLAQSTISQHLKELKDAGLIQGDVMPPRVRYCINQRVWAEARKLFASSGIVDELPFQFFGSVFSTTSIPFEYF